MTNKAEHHGKEQFCRYCLQCFSSSKVCEFQVKNCLVINITKSVLLTEENEYVDFQNFQRSIKASFIIFGNFECTLIPSTDNINFVPSTRNIKIILFVVTVNTANMC